MNICTAIHPGEILLEEFLRPLNLSQYRLAKDIHVPARRINEIVHEKRGVTTDTAMRLAQYFNTTPLFWLHLQAKYEIATKGTKYSDIVAYKSM